MTILIPKLCLTHPLKGTLWGTVWKKPLSIHVCDFREAGIVPRVAAISVTRLGDLLDFGQLFKVFDNN